jgi:hypothetical protein
VLLLLEGRVEEKRKTNDRLSKLYFVGKIDGDDDAQGPYCQDCYSKSMEGWVICCRFHNWASKSCGVSTATVTRPSTPAVNACP